MHGADITLTEDERQDFVTQATAWLEANAEYRTGGSDDKELVWGEGEFSVSVFHSLTFEEERALLDALPPWDGRLLVVVVPRHPRRFHRPLQLQSSRLAIESGPTSYRTSHVREVAILRFSSQSCKRRS